ncbi:MAG: enoyl-CoA hydratase/isomerase family protein [Chloroflexi bacterium]|nr:enoyl-CoA hydratase/isomerase family protein [Chloroflexota bacterium]
MPTASNFETLELESRNGIATINLNRPERLNALNNKMTEEILDVLGLVEKDESISVVVITGAGRAFSAGADIKERFLGKIEERRQGMIDDMTDDFNERAPLALAAVRKPVIAAVNGLAIGWGCTITLGCDMRIASTEARFRLPFAAVGISPEMGSTYYLPRLVGLGMACELVLTARMVDAAEAKEIGLVNRVVPAGDLMKVTYEIAETIKALPPLAVRVSKRLLHQGLRNDLTTQLRHEAFAVNYLRGTKDHEEAAMAFVEKRTPVFKGQ